MAQMVGLIEMQFYRQERSNNFRGMGFQPMGDVLVALSRRLN
jgi:hypothetical protein